MSQSAVEWVVGAIMAVALGIVCVILGMTFLPPSTKAYGDGTLIPWLLAWSMIWVAVLAAVAIAGFLVVTGRREGGVRRG